MSDDDNRRGGLVIRHRDELPYAEAKGLGPVPKTEDEIRARLNFIEAHLADSAVPDARGKPVGAFRDANTGEHIPGGWELVPLPDDLREDAEYLAEAVLECRAALEADGLDAAAKRMDGIDRLIAKMRHDADPARRRGARSKQDAQRGGQAKNSDYADKRRHYQPALEAKIERNPHLSVTGARRLVAQDYGVTRRTVQRYTYDPRQRKK